MNEHGFIHTPWFYRPVVEKVNYENLKTETIISCNCLQEKEVFFPLENFTMPQMRYLSLRFPYNLAKEKKTKQTNLQKPNANGICQIFSTAHVTFKFIVCENFVDTKKFSL